MGNLPTGLILTVSVLFSQWVVAADHYTVPRTEWDQPDLQGVWNFSSEVPMERPEQFGAREFLTEVEIATSRESPLRIGRADSVTRTASGVEAFYNDSIWMENLRAEGAVRTSHIVYPLNGRIPPLAAGVEYLPGGTGRVAGARPVRFAVGGIGRDGPEDRGLSERCIVGFNAGPQLMPSVYNNNVQIVQNRDHVVILSEMIHDSRLVKLGELPSLNKEITMWSGGGDAEFQWTHPEL